MLRSIICLAASLFAAALVSAAEQQVFTIKTLAAQMRYDLTEITVGPGADVKIIFENTDDMPHNLVFFQAGTDVVAVCNKQMEKPEEALKRDWIPDDPRMWLKSKMLNPKQKDELVFKAPEKVGTYPFVCTFPGHAQTMQGKLKVSAPGPKFTDLKFQMYLGDWKTLPDFSKLTPHREGDLPDKLIEIKLDDYKNQFGVVYTGKLVAPKDGEYTFAITGDDGVRLFVNGKKVAEHDGIHPASEIREGKTKLTAGEHTVRLEYFQAAGEAEVFAAWKGADFSLTPLSKWLPADWEKSGQPKKESRPAMPLVVTNEAVVYRNFIQGAGNRGIAVGYPGGFNLAWSAESMNLTLLWRGAFMDASKHWVDRGGGHQPPLGYDVLKIASEGVVPLAVLSSADAAWPRMEKKQRAAGYQWKGYTLDAKRFPTFSYTWQGVAVTDRFDVAGGAVTGAGRFIRTVKLAGAIPANAMFLAASGKSIQPAREANTFVVEPEKFTVAVEGAKIVGDGLLVPARAEIKVTYGWLQNHGEHVHAH